MSARHGEKVLEEKGKGNEPLQSVQTLCVENPHGNIDYETSTLIIAIDRHKNLNYNTHTHTHIRKFGHFVVNYQTLH